MKKKKTLLLGFLVIYGLAIGEVSFGKTSTWTYITSQTGAIPVPNEGNQQTASQVLDIDKDGTDDFVITERTKSPSVVWYKHNGNRTWKRYVIETQPLHIEAGGDHFDIDGDGDLDIVFCGDYREDSIWWWENPYPNYKAGKTWKRHIIKSGDKATYQHDNQFGDFDGDGKTEMAWWSQKAKKLFLTEIPDNPRQSGPWSYKVIFTWKTKPGHEGMDVADINLDGKADIVGAGFWFEHVKGTDYKANLICKRPFTRSEVGQLIPGGRPEVVISPGDANGPVEWYEWKNNKWVKHQLIEKIIHGHTLEVRDIDTDGNLDIFVAEMGRPGAGADAKTIILWGDGRGKFRQETIDIGKANHESRLGDLDGDGDIDIMGKPYNFGSPGLHVWLQEKK